MTRHVTVLGSTGSIGANTLDVIARHPDRFQVFALTARDSVDTMYEQCLQFKPRYAVLVSDKAATVLRQRLAGTQSGTEVLAGAESLVQVASDPAVTTVMAAIV